MPEVFEWKLQKVDGIYRERAKWADWKHSVVFRIISCQKTSIDSLPLFLGWRCHAKEMLYQMKSGLNTSLQVQGLHVGQVRAFHQYKNGFPKDDICHTIGKR